MIVDNADLNEWFTHSPEPLTCLPPLPYLHGDADLDGHVDALDFDIWDTNKFVSAAAWSRGDFNADGVVDGQDFIEWNINKFQSSDGAAQIMLPQTLREPQKIDATGHIQVNEANMLGTTNAFPPLAPLAEKRVDSVFATRRRGVDQSNEPAKIDPLENPCPFGKCA